MKNRYSYKLEDYGSGLISYVILRNRKEIFHSNGYPKRKQAIFWAKRMITEFKTEDKIF